MPNGVKFPYFSLEFCFEFTFIPVATFPETPSPHSHLDCCSSPDGSLPPLGLHPFILHATRSILHSSPLLKSSSVSQLPWGLNPNFLEWYTRLSIIWPLLTSCFLGRIILLWDFFYKNGSIFFLTYFPTFYDEKSQHRKVERIVQWTPDTHNLD